MTCVGLVQSIPSGRSNHPHRIAISVWSSLAGEFVVPEFIQDAATPTNIAGAALELLQDTNRNAFIKARLVEVVASLGGVGASERAAIGIGAGWGYHEPEELMAAGAVAVAQQPLEVLHLITEHVDG